MILTCLIAAGTFAAGCVLGATASKAVADELSLLNTRAHGIAAAAWTAVAHLEKIASPPAIAAELGHIGAGSIATTEADLTKIVDQVKAAVNPLTGHPAG